MRKSERAGNEKIMNFGENALLQIKFLERKKKNIEEELKELPEGSLWTKRIHGTSYYYSRKDGKTESLAGNQVLLNQYQRKRELEHQLKVIQNDIPLIEKMLKRYIPLAAEDSWWDTLKSEQNPFRSQDRQSLYRGIFYRSKSEVTIAMFLDSYQIPYKYEVEVKISESKSRYPDFCIKRPKDQKVIYWEHCGLISKETYQNDLYFKLKEYHSVGIDLWDNLILTFDQYDGGLNADTIEKVIQLYLL